ncbi:MAG: DUF4435 domain-containing protein [Paramuribaculum sp.]|nr:DUF4435 domain-containing protein [Paramuribaculum sp.]
MAIVLPPRKDGSAGTIESDTGRLIIIGANGAGKSRFTAALQDELGERAFSLSALRGLYGTNEDSPLKELFDKSFGKSAFKPQAANEIDALLALLMHDEMLNLINYKTELTLNPDAKLHKTKLDIIAREWKELFPDNNILVESGKFLFSRGEDPRSYSALKLSDGEKAAIYYLAAVMYAPKHGAIFIDSPEMFMHPSIMQNLWNRIESLRSDCLFVFTTHDLEFASQNQDSTVVWVRDYDAASVTWDYDILPKQDGMSDEVYMAIIGARKPVLFIEGDGVHSIDAKLYPLVFSEYTVKSLGSCNKVIEATRTFNDLNAFHHLDSFGIVDRDRRDAHEVEYLRGKKVMVPEVAEIENIMMLEEVIKAVAASMGKDESKVFDKVKRSVISQFRHDLRQQALMHTRHRVKRTVEYRIDGRFNNINLFEQHIASLVDEINPRGLYEGFCREFRRYAETEDYTGVLKVYNQKSMISGSNVAALCGLKNKDEYIKTVINLLKGSSVYGERIREAVKECFSHKNRKKNKADSDENEND